MRSALSEMRFASLRGTLGLEITSTRRDPLASRHMAAWAGRVSRSMSCIRHFLMHVLPGGSRVANIAGRAKYPPCRPVPNPEAPAADEPSMLPRPCPCCGSPPNGSGSYWISLRSRFIHSPVRLLPQYDNEPSGLDRARRQWVTRPVEAILSVRRCHRS